MAMRSLSGPVAFLTCLFPYLPEAEAVAYLDAAGADPIVACLLIIRRRGMREFDPCSVNAMAAIEAALRCAAVAAQHPDPQQLVLGWKLLSPHLHMFWFSYASRYRPQDVAMAALNDGAGRTSDDSSGRSIIMEKSWHYAQIRLGYIWVKELPPARAAMKRMLLATIHGFYLEAMARLPTTELCSQYHRGMLMGGYCYGPLDPVSHIIFNALWYEQARRLACASGATEQGPQIFGAPNSRCI
ncbi:hypothetical protein PR202_gb18106 [Eleusine coracana subsp. coracana]|uniref:PIR2-like helical domain-containing protein n=1 Tax=Eleusine coracana subsp. coracana TaxID=191504 RepID=A0AAV5F2C4_ELECO|nr:hypothetical protein PR202_gb18039 [Eleusine coracana subsp. coracana]GJN29848.1 hypothetical protein PR202_gb18106 [Eleusine coracana subsp. coracana]